LAYLRELGENQELRWQRYILDLASKGLTR
jgi:DUF971 family protein